MKTLTLVILTLCLCISAILARPEPDFSHESFSNERFGGYGHGDFSGEDLFDRRGGYGNRNGYYGNNYGGYQGGYYQPGYSPLG
ncbi:hypothetical protein ACKWTF_004237 [Chironomus riparius]